MTFPGPEPVQAEARCADSEVGSAWVTKVSSRSVLVGAAADESLPLLAGAQATTNATARASAATRRIREAPGMGVMVLLRRARHSSSKANDLRSLSAKV